MSDFASAALPWIVMGIVVAVVIAFSTKNNEKQKQVNTKKFEIDE